MNELIAVGIWVLLWIAFVAAVCALVGINRPTRQDDDEQAEAVSRPAPLNPHMSAKNYWTKS